MRSRVGSSRFVIFSVALAAVAAASGQPPGRGGGMPVTVAPIVERDVPPAIRLVGTVLPARRAVVAAEVEGVVQALLVEDGQFVEGADVLCRLNNTVATLRLEEARANFESLQATLAELVNGERAEDVARLEAIVAEAEATARKWSFELGRIRALRAAGQSSDKELHDTEMDELAARQRLAQVKAQLERARNGTRPEVLARARQQVAAQQAVLQRAARDLNKTEIRAPFSGAVVARRVEVGEWIQVGGAVCELVALDTVKVRVDVPESAVRFAVPGAPATVEIESLDSRRTATITRRIPQADTAARTFPVEVDLPNEDHALLAGMFVWAYVPAGPPGNRLMVSKDAIVARGTSKTIYVVRPTGENAFSAFPTPVNTGLELNGEIEVTAPGLKAGDQVVVRANERLMDFPMPVTPRPVEGDSTGSTAPPATQPAASAAR